MTQNELSAIAVLGFIGFALLRGLVRMLRGGRRDAEQLKRLNQAAKRVLKEKKSGRSSVPITQPRSQSQAPGQIKPPVKSQAARSSSQSQQRQHAQNKPSRVTNTARPVAAKSTPAVIRRGASLLSGAREPVIQRRR
jgi:hypothetical protein